MNITVLVSGGGSNLQALIDAIERGEINARINCVISDRPDVFALDRARKHGILPVCINKKGFVTQQDYEAELLSQLRQAETELLVLAGYLSILGTGIIKEYSNKIINIHPSLIPSFCGMGFYGKKVHKAAIEYGVKYSGATAHFVDEGADTGPIIMQEVVPIFPDDDADKLAARVLEVEHKLLPQSVKLFCENRLTIDGRIVRIHE